VFTYNLIKNFTKVCITRVAAAAAAAAVVVVVVVV
jgi:hypothetical protein